MSEDQNQEQRRHHFRHRDRFAHLPEGKALELPPNRPNNHGQLKIVCGPLLRYWGTSTADNVWRGSVAYVTEDRSSKYEPLPKFELADPELGVTEIPEIKYYAAFGYTFWRFDFKIPLGAAQKGVKYTLGTEHPQFEFFVPGKSDEMNVMFYSCNGFSLSTDTSTFPASLWTDVVNKHAKQPFNVMLGGGDQIYCDSISLYLPAFKKWTRKNITSEGFHYSPSDKDKEGMEVFYLKSYVDWFGRGYWKGTNGDTHQPKWVEACATIPMLNIYDDHDIIDGWGSYKDSTMRAPMFDAVGQAAHRYYLLFQQSIAPEGDADQKRQDPSWVSTWKDGPVMRYPARSIYAKLGKSAAFFGLDCRTERTAHQICRSDSYDLMFQRMEQELTQDRDIKHVYVMLGVPIAYPRMVWAEHLMTSGLLKPVKWLARHKVMLKGLVNQFDGQVELLDDLSDHWCAAPHKRERNEFVLRLQDFARKMSVRITILAGDVHLCGVGRFQTHVKSHKEKVNPENDWRYMICPISSAITNTPPPQLLADFMNKRNKHHYLQENVEDLMDFFPEDVDGSAINNKATLARRNYCILQISQKSQDPASLNMAIYVEKDSQNEAAETKPYSMDIPSLDLSGNRAQKPPAAGAVPNGVHTNDTGAVGTTINGSNPEGHVAVPSGTETRGLAPMDEKTHIEKPVVQAAGTVGA